MRGVWRSAPCCSDAESAGVWVWWVQGSALADGRKGEAEGRCPSYLRQLCLIAE